MGCNLEDESVNSNDPAAEIHRLRRLVTLTRETLMATVHHLFLAATVCDQVGFPSSADQMREMIDRLRLLADRLDAAAAPIGDD